MINVSFKSVNCQQALVLFPSQISISYTYLMLNRSKHVPFGDLVDSGASHWALS